MTDDPNQATRLPEGADEFVRLCNRLYFDLDEWTGGPLHVALEDGNLGWLLGDLAERQLTEFAGAIALIESGNIPTSANRLDAAADNAYYFGSYDGDKSDALRCAIDILNVCKGWTEAELEAVYSPWAHGVYRDLTAARTRYLASKEK